MDSYSVQMDQGALRLAIDGDWSCQEFAALLDATDDAYRRVNSIFVLRQALDQENASNRRLEERNEGNDRDFSWHLQFHGFRHHFPGGNSGTDAAPYSELMELANSLSGPLQVGAITYASPGWIQLIGNWNPLKVIADSVRNWRAENTKREANWLNAQTEQMRIQADLASKILAQAPKMHDRYDAGSSRLVELAAEVIKPTTKYVERLNADSRIISAEVVSVHEPLPSRIR